MSGLKLSITYGPVNTYDLSGSCLNTIFAHSVKKESRSCNSLSVFISNVLSSFAVNVTLPAVALESAFFSCIVFRHSARALASTTSPFENLAVFFVTAVQVRGSTFLKLSINLEVSFPSLSSLNTVSLIP